MTERLNDYILTGHTPLTDRMCLRCHCIFQSVLYQLCDDCRQDDVERQAEIKHDVADMHDREMEIQNARNVY